MSILDQRICPGCGSLNPENKSGGFNTSAYMYFECAKCDYESVSGLPTIGELVELKTDFTDCNNVNLQQFTRTLVSLLHAKAKH